MNRLRGNSGPTQQQQFQQQQALAMAEQELEAFSDLFSRMTHGCWTKCIANNYADGSLAKGETVCIDRCVAKFAEVHTRIGQSLAEMQQAQQGAAPAAPQ
ncbi:hypothetical protein CAOG_05856 [Capsaspora owczarzaki ATCC 30864]|uniref:Mitochondrial import inner membrane translocase subunit n=1 Tax=Capsaspora owczarzaki (strain ATCC 30864) TaxID=595528 RepID=A0A0D2VVB0_CAPO3|nr:hypothetical protein CAOG_05856 [Capsaspora owczarzaki ATCC 30864]KJE95402.1 hypothetical protein CAOG_005856 [Capsaspora owczarzaki ATCC 30864]|eukprot:XP_004345446.1 hypothetical protein CAOG_05856 [Capsaspora owczarzaki ATCC 30864]